MKKLKYYYSSFYLGKQFFIHVIKRIFLFWQPAQGYEKFKGNFYNEKIYELTGEERALLWQFNRCLGCGACLLKSRGMNPTLLALSFSRDLSEFLSANDVLEKFSNLEESELVCPNEVPLIKIKNFVKERIKFLEGLECGKRIFFMD